MRPLLEGKRRLAVERSKALWVATSALCLGALAAVLLVHSARQTTELAGAPNGGYWGGYYDAGYYGAYNNPYAYDVARQDYWNAMNAYDAAGVWSYNDWVEQRRDWDRAGYGYGPYDSAAHAEYWRSADQNGWGDQTRYNNYLSAYNAEAGGEYPYGYPSIEDNYEWQGGGYPSIADNWEQRGGMYRRASDMKDSNHQGKGLRTTGEQTSAKAVRTSTLSQTSKRARKPWQPMKYKQLATVHLSKKAPADDKLAYAKKAYKQAAAAFRHAYPGATYQQWMEKTGQWDNFFVRDRILDTEQVTLDERKAAALKSVLPPPAFPALHQLDTAEEQRVRVRAWTPQLHLGPICKATMLASRGGHKKRWQDTQACQLCRDEGSDCDKCAANAKQMLCEFVSMPKPVPASLLHFTPEGTSDIHMPKRFSFASSGAEHGTQLSEIKAAAREERDIAAEKSEEKAAKDYAVVDETLAPLNELQAQLNQARLDLYVSEFGMKALRLFNGPAFSAKLPQLTQALPGYLRWRDSSQAHRVQQQHARVAAAKAPTQSLAQSGDSKLMKLGVNLGGNPFLPAKVTGLKVKGRSSKHSGMTKLYPATSGTDHYKAPGSFHENCEGDSPTALCDQGVFVGEQEQTHAQDLAIDTERMEGSYNAGVSPVRELTPNTLGGDFFGHMGSAPMTREQVQELTR